MSPVDRLSHVLNTLRKSAIKSTTSRKAASTSIGRLTTADAQENGHEIRRKIGVKLQGLDLSIAEHQDKAATVFLEAVLTNEFGMDLLTDPTFRDLLNKVRSDMLSDTDAHKSLLNLLATIRDSG
jgi:hypothetical protein